MVKPSDDTRTLYNDSADRWVRKEPNSLSDFTARPAIFELCGDVSGQRIIDLGAGEGYCAREMASRGAGEVTGVELSEEMVAKAKAQQAADDKVIDYQCGTVTDLKFEAGSFDLALGVFVYNYLHIDDVHRSFKEVYRVLKPGGRFIFSVPHPSFPFIRKEKSRPFYFDTGDKGYFSGRDQLCHGEIFCRDGTALNVQMIPKSLEDYFEALAASGFTSLPQVKELAVTPAMVELDADFFAPLVDIPLHMAFVLSK